MADFDLYEQQVMPHRGKAAEICAEHEWELSCIVAYERDRYVHYHSGAERFFIEHSTTMSRIEHVHGMNLIYRPIRKNKKEEKICQSG